MAATPPFLSPVSHQLLFSQIGAMVLLISPEPIELESCVSAQNISPEKGNRWIYPDDARDLS